MYTITSTATALAYCFAPNIDAVIAVATHPVLSGQAIDRLSKSEISKVIVCNTIELDKSKNFEKLKVIDVSDVFGESIKRIVDGTSLSSMFKNY